MRRRIVNRPAREDPPDAATPLAAARQEARRIGVGVGALLVVMVFAAYVPALRAGFVWDDGALTKNEVVRSLRGLWLIWTRPSAYARHEVHYWPLVYTTFWLEYALWGLRPFGYHLVNVLLHAANSVLIWRLLSRLGAPGAWLAAAVFALHPVHVESVAWVIELKDQLATLFYVLAFGAYIRFESSENPRAYAATVALFVCAMLSKSVAVSLPLAIALWVWWQRGRLTQRDVGRLGPLLALGLAIAALDAAWATKREPFHSGLCFVERGLLAARELWFYAGKLAWPADLMTIYPQWEIHAASLAAWVYPMAALAVLVVLWIQRRKWGNGPLAAVLYFAVTLGPTLGLVDFVYMRHSYVADRFQFQASLGLIVLFSGVAAWTAERIKGMPRWLPAAGAGALLAVLGVLTWIQAGHYKNYELLFSDTLAKNPRSWAAHNNLGMALTDQKRYDEALKHYDASLRINPRNYRAWYNKGWTYHLMGRIDDAIPSYREALRLSPRYCSALVNLGAALRKKGQVEEAIQCYRKALQVEPNNAAAHNNLGSALCQAGKIAEGVEHFREAVKIQPDFAMAKDNLKLYEPRLKASGTKQ